MTDGIGAFGFTPNGQSRIDLHQSSSAGIRIIDLIGAGAVDADIQTVRTPSRDGEVYVRTILPPRFLIAQLELYGDTVWTSTQGLRRTLISALNPRLGIGVVDWQPIPGGNTYLIDAVVAGGLDFKDKGGDWRALREYAPISFRCPDPTWRVSPANTAPIGASGGGLDIPLDIPWDMAEGGDTETITNTGDVDTYPVITTDGTFTSITITNTTTGKSVSFQGLTVTSPAVLTIDMDARTADVDGTNVMPYRTADSEAWPLVPGNNNIAVSVSSGAVDLTVTYYDRVIGV